MTDLTPVNGQVILKLPPLEEKSQTGVILNEKEQLVRALNARRPFQVLAIDPSNTFGIKSGDFVYMHPSEFNSPSVISYDNLFGGVKVALANVYQILAVKSPKRAKNLGKPQGNMKNVTLT